MSSSIIEKLLSRSIPEPNSGCWLWLGAINGLYGILQTNKIEYAHRISFQVFVRPLIGRELVCHRCDNTFCVNPDHLFAGSYKDNQQDCMQKGRWTRGERHGMAILKENEVISIRELFTEGARYVSLAEEYGISQSQIRRITSGRAWADTEGILTPNRRSDIILTREKAEEIRAKMKTKVNRKNLAKSFGITLATLYAVNTGRIWKLK